jgi:hypothetical protein
MVKSTLEFGYLSFYFMFDEEGMTISNEAEMRVSILQKFMRRYANEGFMGRKCGGWRRNRK